MLGDKDSEYKVMSEMNVTPMVDVMFVLLVLFLVSMPLLIPQTLGIDLPETQALPVADPEPEAPMRIGLRSNGVMEVDGEVLSEQGLSSRLVALSEDPSAKVLIEADKAVLYERVASVLVMAQNAGVRNIGFMTIVENE